MAEPGILFEDVWKKFRKGQRHDSLRDLIPSALGVLVRRRPPRELQESEFWVLKNVSFEVRPGEVLGIIGQNGAGKSTVLKLLTRILRPTLGRAQVRGRVGALIEVAAGFHPDLTGRENIYLQGAVLGMRRPEIQRQFDAIVAFSGLEEFIDTPIKRYSSGMNARLGFSIAAHIEPDVLLIDEVLAVGDFTFQQKCYARLEEFRRSGVAIAFVSHNMQAVASLCDKAMLLRPGEAALIGPVADITGLYGQLGAATDGRVTVLSSRLDHPNGAPLDAPVAPGAQLMLTVELRSLVELPRCGVCFHVVRSDGVVIFTGMSTLDGLPETFLDQGTHLSARIAFTAALLRGTYRIDILLVDAKRMWKNVVIQGLQTFVISETSRIAGCAELAPMYDIRVSPGSRVSSITERQPTI